MDWLSVFSFFFFLYTFRFIFTRLYSVSLQLQVQNDDGLSRWSEEATVSTTADRPAAPARPSVKGRIQSNSFRVRWDPPLDAGGAPVSQYSLELDSGTGFTPMWTGTDTELTCDKLTPGTTYRVRISCFNGQEHSDVSETLIVTTEPVCPGAPAPPHLVGKARSTSLQLEWGKIGCLFRRQEMRMLRIRLLMQIFTIVSLLWRRATGIRWRLDGNSVRSEFDQSRR